MKIQILVLLFLLFSKTLLAADISIEYPFAQGGVVHLTFHNEKIGHETLKRYLVIHPEGYDPDYHVGVPLNLCIEKDLAYKPCGTRDYRAKNFLENATYNVSKTRRLMKELQALRYFQELQPLVDYFVRSLSFALWKDETLLEYYRTWNSQVLNKDYGNLQIRHATKSILSRLKASTTTQERWEIATLKWANATVGLYRKTEGNIPKAVWTNFLASHGIDETVNIDMGED